MEISRTRRKKGLFLASFFALLIILGFASAKASRFHPMASLLFYVAPQLVALFFAFWSLRKTSRGWE
jgi:hypothetical protein